MSFEQIRQIAGQMDGQYQKKMQITAEVVAFDPVKFNEKGKKFQQVLISDGVEQQKVKIWLGNGPEIMMIGTMTFEIGPNPYQNNMYYAGFWDGKAPTGGQQAPQNTAKAPHAPAGATNSTKTDKEAYEAKEREKGHGMCFHGLMEATLRAGVGAIALTTDPETIKALANLATMCMNSYDYRTPKADMGIPPY